MNAPNNALALVPSRPRALALSDDELIAALRNSIYPGATDQSIRMVIAWCRAAGKDPIKKPVHIVPMSVKKPGTRNDYEWRDVIMPGIVDYRTDAARTGQYAGNSEAEFGPDVLGEFGERGSIRVTYPAWCEFKVYRLVNGERCAFSSGRVRWLESYATAGKDTDAPNAMWRKRPYGQLEKCAEAMALRRAFPEVGAQPTADEMVGRVIEGDDLIVEDAHTATARPARNRRQLIAHFIRRYWRVTRTSTSPRPDDRPLIALPSTAPVARVGSDTFIACPAVFDVVRRSPGLIAPCSASAWTYTRPVKATFWSPSIAPAWRRLRPVLMPPAPLMTPATRGS